MGKKCSIFRLNIFYLNAYHRPEPFVSCAVKNTVEGGEKKWKKRTEIELYIEAYTLWLLEKYNLL